MTGKPPNPPEFPGHDGLDNLRKVVICAVERIDAAKLWQRGCHDAFASEQIEVFSRSLVLAMQWRIREVGAVAAAVEMNSVIAERMAALGSDREFVRGLLSRVAAVLGLTIGEWSDRRSTNDATYQANAKPVEE